ncbi:branched-chain amino acid ABC transporter permease [Sporomusa sp.]|jgi:branched-chain amino acid transport system permease protein|uniref:branched-chain amino acid ABC transporter permease n=1 Tax=Sporomusa sp. TaxID=2078658 RepID=UPI002C9BBF40|nr:branched-chain amino acid ABC transporter permease [Sporomusa sp.]MDF2876307.1 livH 2 [Sporomusa sp.]HWR08391.1 branched-chain amino acid ABC transporter permease [Sporomusa sp.]
MLIQTLVTGLAIGGIYALMAVGYSLVFSILNFSNFAYGSIIMLGAYIGYYLLMEMGMPVYLAIFGSIAGAAFLCLLNERLAYSTLRKRNAPSLYFMISAMGTSIFLENFVYATIGSRFYAFPEVLTQQNISYGGVSIGMLDVFAIVFSFAAIYALHYFLQNSRTGIAIRAASYDMQVSQLNGVNITRTIGWVFLLAGALAGISGMFLGMKYMVYPTMGWITNKAYIAAVIGGLGSLPGAVVGGLLLGVLETFVSAYVSSVVRDVFSFSLLVILLLVLPTGLFGKFLEEKV